MIPSQEEFCLSRKTFSPLRPGERNRGEKVCMTSMASLTMTGKDNRCTECSGCSVFIKRLACSLTRNSLDSFWSTTCDPDPRCPPPLHISNPELVLQIWVTFAVTSVVTCLMTFTLNFTGSQAGGPSEVNTHGQWVQLENISADSWKILAEHRHTSGGRDFSGWSPHSFYRGDQWEHCEHFVVHYTQFYPEIYFLIYLSAT